MGNLNSPTINRWGTNVFWPKMWYSDNDYSSNLQQDKIFETLLNVYLRFGLYIFKDFFYHPYWHYNQQMKSRVTYKNQLMRYFRWKHYRQEELNIDSIQRYRVETIDFFHLTTWILKFAGWVVLNLYWFKPYRKKKNIIALKKGKKLFLDFFPSPSTPTINNVKRFKITLFNSLYTNTSLKCYYTF